jgi:hypothetical protein
MVSYSRRLAMWFIKRLLDYKNMTHPDFGDNMNCLCFGGHARFLKTNRMRKVNVTAFTLESAYEKLAQQGFDINDCDIQRVPFKRPTENQLNAMKTWHDPIPLKFCFYDASAIISFYSREDTKPPQELVDYADQFLYFSHYSGEHILVRNLLYSTLPEEERYAFYLAVVRKFLLGKYYLHFYEGADLEAAKELLQDSRTRHSFQILLNGGVYDFDGYEEGCDPGRRACYLAAKKYILSD